MTPGWIKRTYYAALAPFMMLNAMRHRLFPVRLEDFNRAQLGPGQNNHFPGWINVDANIISARPEIWGDLKFKLPFPDSTMDCIYSHHVVEHLPDLDFHFSELSRCLKPGGVIRVGGPHGDNAIKAFERGLHEWFGDWPEKRESLGGRLENFIYCGGEHLALLTESYLTELCEKSGFVDIQIVDPGVTCHEAIFSVDVLSTEYVGSPELPSTVVVEARKPQI
jgi:predicted SAM-dependent methyltransferase